MIAIDTNVLAYAVDSSEPVKPVAMPTSAILGVSLDLSERHSLS